MKILYDHQIFSAAAFGGISRYFCELFTEFNEMGVSWEVSAKFSNNFYLQSLSPRLKFFPNLKCPGKNRILEALNYFGTIKKLQQGDFDIFHSTYSKPYNLSVLHNKPYVITVHDLTHEKFTNLLPSAQREVAEEKESIARANAIIVPSNATKNDLIDFYPQVADKISVIYHGFRIPQGINHQFDYLKPYCIYVGTRAFYKDFFTAVEAFCKMPRDLKFLCIGGGSFTSEEKKRFNSMGIADRIYHHSADERSLFSAYASAEMLLFPSIAEGFGLPIIEAQSQQCPPILADIPSAREIGGNGALYFKAKDINGCAKMMDEVLHNPELKKSLQNKMLKNTHRFSWKQAAAETLAVYEKLLN